MQGSQTVNTHITEVFVGKWSAFSYSEGYNLNSNQGLELQAKSAFKLP